MEFDMHERQKGMRLFHMERRMNHAIQAINHAFRRIRSIFMEYSDDARVQICQDIEKLWFRLFECESASKTENFMMIFMKDQEQKTHTLLPHQNLTISQLMLLGKNKIGTQEQIRFSFDGNQLDEQQKTLDQYKLQKQAILHVQLVSYGDIGVFENNGQYQHRRFLADNQTPSPQQVESIVKSLQGNQAGTFKQTQLEESDGYALDRLVELADERHRHAKDVDLEDFKFSLTRGELKGYVGEAFCQQVEGLFETEYSDIVVRRCEAHGKYIGFHTDFSKKTLQVVLNDSFVGGRLVFLAGRMMHVPARKKGTVTIHDNRIVHAVTVQESGVRYGLFLLQK